MSITVSGKNVDVGESLKTFIIDEIQSAMDQYVGDFIDAHIVMTKGNGLFGAEIDVHIARGFTLRSRGQDADPYNCVTQAVNILKQRTKQYKARLRGRERRLKDTAPVLESSRFVLACSQEEEKMQDSPLIIAEMSDTIPTLSAGDAVMQLDLSEAPVFMFKNVSTGQLNVVYRRSDGNIGWVAPKA